MLKPRSFVVKNSRCAGWEVSTVLARQQSIHRRCVFSNTHPREPRKPWPGVVKVGKMFSTDQLHLF